MKLGDDYIYGKIVRMSGNIYGTTSLVMTKKDDIYSIFKNETLLAQGLGKQEMTALFRKYREEL